MTPPSYRTEPRFVSVRAISLRRNNALIALLFMASIVLAIPVLAELRFDRLDPSKGLSQFSANVVIEDRTGLIWIGSQDGLNRFDGYKVEVFKHDPRDSSSIADNFIAGLFEDSRGSIWIAMTAPGVLNRFDTHSETFERLMLPRREGGPPLQPVNPGAIIEYGSRHIWAGTFGSGLFFIDLSTGLAEQLDTASSRQRGLASDGISCLLVDRSGTLWVGTFGGGLVRYKGLVDEIHEFEPITLPGRVVSEIFEDQSSHLWIGLQDGGLQRLEPDSGKLTSFPPVADESLGITGNVVFNQVSTTIAEQASGHIWVVTTGGATRLAPDLLSATHFRNDANRRHRLMAPNLSVVKVDSEGLVWIGSIGGGLHRFNSKSQGFERSLHDPTDPQSLSSNFVNSIFEDRSGLLWIGTANGGAARFSSRINRFKVLNATPIGPLADAKAFALDLDPTGDLWVGTLEGGLNHIDRSRRTLLGTYTFAPGEDTNIGSATVRAVITDSRGTVWVGTTGGGLSAIDPARGRVIARYTNDPENADSLANNNINEIIEDTQGRLWVCTTFGLDLFDRDTGIFSHFRNDPSDPTSLVHNFARFVYEDDEGTMWVGTGGGFSRFDVKAGTFENYSMDLEDPCSLASNNTMDLWRDPEGSLWIATYGGGLDRLDLSTGVFYHFTVADGLPTDSIYSVIPDGRGHLWISTNQGICKFDLTNHTVRNYDPGDGIGGNEFNGRSFSTAIDGELLFGGMHGVTMFHPDQIDLSEFQPEVVLRAFRRLGKKQNLSRNINELDRVELSYKDAFFSFEFAALDYNNPGKNRYAYRLEGFDKNWVETGSRRFANYTNLDGGTYTFRVRGSNVDGVWSENEASIDVIVIPPPWKTWWAYGLYGLAAIGSVATYNRYRTKEQEAELRIHREEAARQRLHAERLEQIDHMKDEFLANTSHELRTPLNGIIGIAESLCDGATGELPDATRSNLFMVAASGRRLSHLVDDILDFSKLKNHQIELSLSAVTMRSLIDVVLTLSRPLVVDSRVDLINETSPGLPPVHADENRLQQILHNLIGNAIKFTDEGKITVTAEQFGDLIEVRVADTGVGIPANKLNRIFESFEQADASTAREYGGTGLGLTITRQLVELHGGTIRATSDEGEGSCFCFTLPRWQGESTNGPKAIDSTIVRRIRDLESLPALQATDGRHPKPVTALPSANRAQLLAGKRILAVDDEPINLQVLDNILTLEGAEIERAADGFHALEAVDKNGPPDLVLLDVMMPRMTGFEVCQELRKVYSANHLPIILLTAKNQVADLVNGLASGANDYLTKPFSKPELVARIRTHLDLSRAHTAEAENQRKGAELEQARAIQLSMLPDGPPALPFLDVAVHMQTATEVGGDYYDFFSQEDGSLYAICGDATGHGISAGMMVSMTKSALRALGVQSPHVLLQQLNRVIRAVNPERMMMALNILKVSESDVAMASAGMPPVYVLRSSTGAVEEKLLSSLPLGAMTDPNYSLDVFPFDRGDTLIMISDGLPELTNRQDDQLGYDALENALSVCHNRSASEIVQHLLETGQQWSGGTAARDDITLVVLRHT